MTGNAIHHKDPTKRLALYACVLATLWTAAIALFLDKNIQERKTETWETARGRALTAFDKDLVYRRWCAAHGGVYVPVTEQTPPNPYLSRLPNRDVLTTTGETLTLVNPAYMTRQVHALEAASPGLRSHITSLNPLRPDNAPDEWEHAALETFDRGADEACAIADINGVAYMRLMHPLITEQGCLKCHAAQGYQLGEIRGGVSVSTPMAPLWASEKTAIFQIAASHALIWLLGLGGIVLGSRNLKLSLRERMRGEVKLRERDSQLAAVFSTSPDILILKDRQYVYRVVNPAFCDFIGRDEADIVGKTDFDLFSQVEAAAYRREDARVLTTGETWTQDEAVTTKGGGRCWMSISKSPVRDGNKITGVFSTARDINARKLAEDTLLRERELFTSGPVVVFRWTAAEGWPVEYASPNVEQLFGYTAQDFISGIVNFADVVHPNDLPRVVNEVVSYSDQGLPAFEQEYRIVRADGESRWLYDYTVVRRDDDGRITHYEGYVLDSTEHKKAEENVQAERTQLLSIFDSMDEVIYVADPDTYELLYCNEAFAKKWDNLIGEKCHKLLQNRDEPCPFCTNHLIFGENLGKTHVWEFQNEVTQRWYRCIDRAIRWSDGRMVRFEMAIDITEARTAEHERIALERQVLQSQKMDSLGVLAGGIAHDFNNLLVGVLGYAELALDSLPPNAPARENILGVTKSAKRAADLTHQMLAYSGKGKFVIERLDLSELVREMANLMEVSISKKITLKYDFAENLPAVEADGTQIRQVVMNLITNASEAIDGAVGVISVCTGVTECCLEYLKDTCPNEHLPPGPYVYVEVSDTGVGMDQQTLARIFEPFFTTKFTGRGLGLAAVLGIMRGHKGALKVDSEPGKRTTVRALFPAVGPPAAVSPKAPARDEEWRAQSTILLVDDEETVLEVGKQYLERKGFEVLTAVDGADALELYRRTVDQVDAVILDLMMPRMDGDECFRELRRIRSDIPVLLSSGYNEQELRQRFIDRGFADFLQKPYDGARLLSKLKDALQTARSDAVVDAPV